MDEEQLKELGISKEQVESALRGMLESGFAEELMVFGLAQYLREIIETAVSHPEDIENLLPIMEFEMPKKGIKIVVSIEKLEEGEDEKAEA